MKNIFTKHPHSIGENYWQHCWFAFLFGAKMIVAGLACVVHAFLPFLFIKTGSNCLIKLMQEYLERMPATETRVEQLADIIEAKKMK